MLFKTECFRVGTFKHTFIEVASEYVVSEINAVFGAETQWENIVIFFSANEKLFRSDLGFICHI